MCGGVKVIPFALPMIEDDEIAAVVDTLKSGWLTMGPKTFQLEEKLKELTGAKHCVVVNSCTAALHLTLLAAGIGPGDEVITSPYTFASTGNMIDQVGARSVFVDVQRDTGNIDYTLLKKAITRKTVAIIPVDFAGQPCDYDEINEIADKNELVVIADAAHSIGAKYHDRNVGTLADATCLSFYATKCVTMGEGGAICTDDPWVADKVKLLRLHGISKDAWKRYTSTGTWYYEIEECGWKYNTTDLNAAIGICQLSKIDRLWKRRKEIASMYDVGLPGLGQVRRTDRTHSHYLYPIMVPNHKDFIEKMGLKGIGCSVHFIPLHLHPYYQNTYGYMRGDFPVTESIYDHEVSLPIYPRMDDASVEYVIKSVQEILHEGPKVSD
jgi:dTDP-4-amino-4,6-dideoxygalactose transaminase